MIDFIRPHLRVQLTAYVKRCRRISLLTVLAAGNAVAGPPASCIQEEPFDYRVEAYRAPVPCTLEGARVVSVEDVVAIKEGGPAVMIDVMPRQRRPANLPKSRLWLPPPRRNLPGSIWLPNVGGGVLPVEEEAYFRANLERITGERPGVKLVFYCLDNCWMSWNAAKRAIEWGYPDVVWFPGGTDAWRAANLPLEDATPIPDESIPDESQ